MSRFIKMNKLKYEGLNNNIGRTLSCNVAFYIKMNTLKYEGLTHNIGRTLSCNVAFYENEQTKI